MTILFRPLGAFGWFSYTTSRDTISSSASISGQAASAAAAMVLSSHPLLFIIDAD
ncbi:hypothetical protein ACU5P0_21555 [Pseudomonas plecoglossicida]|uniref:hypothetical protein n=1 Tax=Pseudomonas plecoglossicida TaxID=70775 RepID=UPI0039E8A3DF